MDEVNKTLKALLLSPCYASAPSVSDKRLKDYHDRDFKLFIGFYSAACKGSRKPLCAYSQRLIPELQCECVEIVVVRVEFNCVIVFEFRMVFHASLFVSHVSMHYHHHHRSCLCVVLYNVRVSPVSLGTITVCVMRRIDLPPVFPQSLSESPVCHRIKRSRPKEHLRLVPAQHYNIIQD